MPKRIEIRDLKVDAASELTENDMNRVSGGIALLLPAVQQAREAASTTQSLRVGFDSLSR